MRLLTALICIALIPALMMLRAAGIAWARLWHAVGLRVYCQKPWRVAWMWATRRYY